MFNQLFSSLFGLSCETKILEACEWDEDRAEVVTEIFCYEMSKISDLEIFEDRSGVYESLAQNLSTSLSQGETDALIEILDDHAARFHPVIQTPEEYEN